MTFEVGYTYYGQNRPTMVLEADSAELALAAFKKVKPGVPENEIKEIRGIAKPAQKTHQTPVYVSYAVSGTSGEFVGFLQARGYTLHVVCRTPEQVERAKTEYAEWSGGKTLSDSAILTSFDGSKWDREWFLIFQYSPDISYPFSILERGTGGNKRSPEPVAWHRRGRIESCYAAIAADVVAAGLEARY